MAYNLNFDNAGRVFRSSISRCQSKAAKEALQIYDNQSFHHHRWEDVVRSIYAVAGYFERKDSARKYADRFNSSVESVRQDEIKSVETAAQDKDMLRYSPKDYRDMGSPDLFLLSMVFHEFRVTLEDQAVEEGEISIHCRIIAEYFEHVGDFGGLSAIKIGYKCQKHSIYYNAFDSDDYNSQVKSPSDDGLYINLPTDGLNEGMVVGVKLLTEGISEKLLLLLEAKGLLTNYEEALKVIKTVFR